ncbi:hypothetical protein E2562_029309 [Oryza meyeriana var. granulata]|uniref:Uncharacterized protein n=1 Tax=Oryza meyeriana var. granulata TaxID=110450 RepID=A0A6G1E3V8_9ORYZ|nr:hypothetical protein E2562_029309 [Oryza meyeriana var. granulata]
MERAGWEHGCKRLLNSFNLQIHSRALEFHDVGLQRDVGGDGWDGRDRKFIGVALDVCEARMVEQQVACSIALSSGCHLPGFANRHPSQACATTLLLLPSLQTTPAAAPPSLPSFSTKLATSGSSKASSLEEGDATGVDIGGREVAGSIPLR